jgi:membrane-associated protease RseP (regulator of RpoE activity)
MRNYSTRKTLAAAGIVMASLAVVAGSSLAQNATPTPTPTEEATAPTEEAAVPAAETAWLGVAVKDTDGQVVIARVQTGSPADTADLQNGDVIVALNGNAIATADDLVTQVQAAAAGDVITLDITRDGTAMSIEVTLGSITADFNGKGGRGGHGGMGMDNMTLDAITTAEFILHVDLEEADGGYSVVSIDENHNPLTLAAGDVVTSINGQAVADLNLETLATDLAAMDTPTWTVVVTRDGAEVTLTAEAMGRGFGGHLGGGDRNGDQGFDGRAGRGGGRGGQNDNGMGDPNGTDQSTEVIPAVTDSQNA